MQSHTKKIKINWTFFSPANCFFYNVFGAPTEWLYFSTANNRSSGKKHYIHFDSRGFSVGVTKKNHIRSHDTYWLWQILRCFQHCFQYILFNNNYNKRRIDARCFIFVLLMLIFAIQCFTIFYENSGKIHSKKMDSTGRDIAIKKKSIVVQIPFIDFTFWCFARKQRQVDAPRLYLTKRN